MVKMIPVAELRPGMRVARLDEQAWLQRPGLYMVEGVVESSAQIESIVSQGYSEVLVFAGPDAGPNAGINIGPGRDADELRREFVHARQVCLRALKAASQVVMDVAQGRPVDLAPPRAAVHEMLQGMENGTDALVCLARLSRVDAYLCSHMVGVTVVALAFGLHLDLAAQDLQQLGLAAFLHDIGMTRLPLDLLSGHGGLSDFERRELRRHPVFGVGLLRPVRGLSREARRAVLEHHEHHDGSGYPDGIAGESIGALARIVHLADVYDGLTAGHLHGRPLTPATALSRMYSQGGAEFSRADVDRFIKCLGVYPAGSLVRLNTGEVGVVLRNSEAAPLAPLVKVVQGGGGLPGRRLVDLALRKGEGAQVREAVYDPRLDAVAATALAG